MAISPEVVFFVLLLLLNVYRLRTIRRLWGSSDFDDAPVPYWVFGQSAWRAWRRVEPVIVLAGFPFCVELIWLCAADESDSGAAGDVALAAVLVSAGVMVFLMLTLGLFNRQRFAAPPHLRSEREMLRDWNEDDR